MGCRLHPVDFAAVARARGLRAFRIEEPAQAAGVFTEAMARNLLEPHRVALSPALRQHREDLGRYRLTPPPRRGQRAGGSHPGVRLG
ncbi:hypothetical protein [Streptomyces achromogenes]|uniref:hypothetical protein n=1 Tax=Streptomyces achromogenes TaxID=67255 RepID=UPI0036F64102